MLTQAHQWSTAATTGVDFTRIIDTCRQASAGQQAPEVEKFANQLASWALNRRGQLRAEAGQEETALSDFDAAIEADPQRWRAIHNRGVLLAGNGQFEKAFNDFTQTTQIHPQFAKAYSNRAALFVVAGDVQAAIQDYTQAIELDPELTVAYRGLGRACHLNGQLDVALRHYNEAIKLAPNDTYAIVSRADVLTDLGRYAEAAADYERAIEFDPKSDRAQSGSAWLLATCPDDAVRNPALALERAETAIKLTNDEDAAGLDTLAAAQANNGEFAAAAISMHKALELAAPGEKEAYVERLALYQQEKPYRLEAQSQVIQASHQD
jgi:tetratricopeptide (TPR) repeat protein